ncbi:hypothetical protein Gotur_013572, partial [Gossypium turneri]
MRKLCLRHSFTWDVFCTGNVISQIWSYMGVLISVAMPYPRHGLTGDLSSRCQCHVPDMILHGSSHIGAHAMSQAWSYGGPLISVPRHVPDMVLYGTSHNLNIANAMSQTWSYMGSHPFNVMTFVSDTFLMFQRDFLTLILYHLILES